MREATLYSTHNQTKLHVNFPDGGKWVRRYLKETLGGRVNLHWFADAHGTVWWEMSKTHRETLTKALQRRYEGVWVVRDYRTNQACTGSCRAATTDDCECSCGGHFHGGTKDAGGIVAADFLLSSDIRRVARYYPGI